MLSADKMGSTLTGCRGNLFGAKDIFRLTVGYGTMTNYRLIRFQQSPPDHQDSSVDSG